MVEKRSHKGKGLFAGYLPLTVATTVSSAIALIGHVALALANLALAPLALTLAILALALTILALALTILALAVVHAVLKKKREKIKELVWEEVRLFSNSGLSNQVKSVI